MTVTTPPNTITSNIFRTTITTTTTKILLNKQQLHVDFSNADLHKPPDVCTCENRLCQFNGIYQVDIGQGNIKMIFDR